MHEWVAVDWAQGDHTHFTGEGYNELGQCPVFRYSHPVQHLRRHQPSSREQRAMSKQPVS